MKSYAPQVIADSSGQWTGNALRFPTQEEAQGNVRDLEMRWMSVREIRVVESEDPPAHRWVAGRLFWANETDKIAAALAFATLGKEGDGK